MKEKWFSILYKLYCIDSGVIVYEPFKVIKGNYNEKEKVFIDEKDGKHYDCVTAAIPNLGTDDEHLVDALDYEMSKIDNSELPSMYAFPIRESQLKEYCNAIKVEEKEFLEIYEREARGYMLYSLYDENEDDNQYFLADKFQDHEVYDADVNHDLIDVEASSVEDEEDKVKIFILGSGGSFDNDAVDIEQPDFSLINDKKKKKKDETVIRDFDPDELEKNITSEVIGQDHVAKALVSMLYKNKRYYKNNGLKSNMLILGPSGCGKTELIRAIKRHTDYPIAFFDASSATASGYVGSSVTQAIRNLVSVCNGDVEKAENGIIFIDEIDKLAGGEGISKGDVQDELFKMLEGDPITIPSENYDNPSFMFNPKNVTFICAGAAQTLIEQKKKERNKVSLGFSSSEPKEVKKDEEEIIITPEDLIKFGLKPELLRRLPIIKVVRDLNDEDLIRILKTSKISNFKVYQKAFAEVDKVKLVAGKDVYKEIANRAMKEKAGASGLKRVVDDMLEVAVRKIRLLNGQSGELRIYKSTLDNPENFKLYKIDGDKKELIYPSKNSSKVKKLGTK